MFLDVSVIVTEVCRGSSNGPCRFSLQHHEESGTSSSCASVSIGGFSLVGIFQLFLLSWKSQSFGAQKSCCYGYLSYNDTEYSRMLGVGMR